MIFLSLNKNEFKTIYFSLCVSTEVLKDELDKQIMNSSCDRNKIAKLTYALNENKKLKTKVKMMMNGEESKHDKLA